MARKPRPSKKLANVLAELGRGQYLQKLMRVTRQGTPEVVWSFEPSGKHCAQRTAEMAIKSPLLRANADGLFGEESSQTWVAV